MNQHKIRLAALVILAIFVVASGTGVFISLYADKQPPAAPIAQSTPVPTPSVQTVSLVVLGDNLMHMPVVNSCKTGEDSYDMHPLYQHLQPMIQDADIAVIGQETILGGKEFGYSGYPCFNSPQDVGATLVKEGFDVVLCASNHVMDKGTKAIESTLEFWKKNPSVRAVGINDSAEAAAEIPVIERNGVRFAILNYTYGTNGIPVPSEKSYLVNLIDKERIAHDVEKAKAISDFIIVFPHWGTEYALKADDFQKDLAQYLADLEVDLVIGSHPHVIEPTEWYTGKNGNRMLVYYSLGNYASSQREAVNLLGGTAVVTIKADGESVWVDDAVFMPVVTHYNAALTSFTVYPLKDYTDQLAAAHGVAAYDGAVSVQRFKSIVDNVFKDTTDIKIDY